MRSTVLSAFALFVLLCTARGEEKNVGTDAERIQRLLSDHVIQTNALRKSMPLPEFLATLEGCSPRGKQGFPAHRRGGAPQGFGRGEGRKVSALTEGRRMPLAAVLHRALRAEGGVPLDYAIHGGSIVITRPRLAAHSTTYLVRDHVGLMPRLVKRMARGLPGGNESDAELYDDIAAKDGPALLVRLLAIAVDLAEWESVEISNGVSLVVSASPRRQTCSPPCVESRPCGS